MNENVSKQHLIEFVSTDSTWPQSVDYLAQFTRRFCWRISGKTFGACWLAAKHDFLFHLTGFLLLL